MGRDHEYYSDQCAECRWAEWRGGCLNKATADDGLGLDAADKGKCTHFEAGEPQGPQPDAEAILMVTLPKERLDATLAKLAAAEKRAADAEAALKQAQDDGRLMLAHLGSGMWRRLDRAGRTRLEQELDSSLRNSTEDDGERIPHAELYAYRRLLMLGDFFDNPCGPLVPVSALAEPELGDDEDDEVDDDE